MTKQERLAIVQRTCAALWARRAWIDTDMATDALLDDPAWQADGYDGDYPWERARRYVRAHLKELKAQGQILVHTHGTEHYNAGGTLVRYYLAGRTDPLGRCGWCWQAWPKAGLEVVDEVGTVACEDCRAEHRVMEAMNREGEEWMRQRAAETQEQS